MALDKKYIDYFINVTSKAALASYFYLGKNNKNAADEAAVNAMRKELNEIDMRGEVVIGEGELDEAPMLFIGEKVGNNNGPSFDIAVDPLEGTNFAAKNLPGALSVIAVGEKNNLLKAPETYMDKIAIRSSKKDLVDLDFPLKKNISNLADHLNKDITELTACILDRPRHIKIIDELKLLGVKLKLITDGDVSGALLVTDEKYNVDIYLGIGGGPEGVLAAAALDVYNCNFQGRFIFAGDEDKKRARLMGIHDFKKKYELNEIVSGDTIFCATGITHGDIVNGISVKNNKFISETLVTHKSTNTNKIVVKEDIIKT